MMTFPCLCLATMRARSFFTPGTAVLHNLLLSEIERLEMLAKDLRDTERLHEPTDIAGKRCRLAARLLSIQTSSINRHMRQGSSLIISLRSGATSSSAMVSHCFSRDLAVIPGVLQTPPRVVPITSKAPWNRHSMPGRSVCFEVVDDGRTRPTRSIASSQVWCPLPGIYEPSRESISLSLATFKISELPRPAAGAKMVPHCAILDQLSDTCWLLWQPQDAAKLECR
ncbi:hypothetical protein IWZ00DRAFT_302636 [Phyllosticta capitalensis]|uniref:Uncharacterized protein n=1 Tax=Phyllosticta capitalensis TaxID=121624 RepID=A0ABR1YKU0_9PEZI